MLSVLLAILRQHFCLLIKLNVGVFSTFYQLIKSLIQVMKCVLKHQDLHIFATNMINFQPIEVVGRSSEPQLQVSTNYILMLRFRVDIDGDDLSNQFSFGRFSQKIKTHLNILTFFIF